MAIIITITLVGSSLSHSTRLDQRFSSSECSRPAHPRSARFNGWERSKGSAWRGSGWKNSRCVCSCTISVHMRCHMHANKSSYVHNSFCAGLVRVRGQEAVALAAQLLRGVRRLLLRQVCQVIILDAHGIRPIGIVTHDVAAVKIKFRRWWSKEIQIGT